jgi:chorismate synthase
MTERDHTLRHLGSLDDFRACVELQEDVWGSGFSERVPTAILKVGQALGGVSAGAFDQAGRLDAFVFGLTGLDEESRPVHWSDMLAVRAGAGGRGLATRLKWFQREAVMGRGITRMFWTFDPLRARNAHLNLNKLGAVVREYRENMYGETDSELHRGIGTDRFVALWQLDSDRVLDRAGRPGTGSAGATPEPPAPRGGGPARADDETEKGGGRPMAALAAVTPDGAGDPRPGSVQLGLTDRRVGVAIPSDIGAVMSRDPTLAMEWREATRAALIHYLERGYEVRELMRGDEAATGSGGVASYVLEYAPTSPTGPVAPGGARPLGGRP